MKKADIGIGMYLLAAIIFLSELVLSFIYAQNDFKSESGTPVKNSISLFIRLL